jgi:hypothetical protein
MPAHQEIHLFARELSLRIAYVFIAQNDEQVAAFYHDVMDCLVKSGATITNHRQRRKPVPGRGVRIRIRFTVEEDATEDDEAEESFGTLLSQCQPACKIDYANSPDIFDPYT